MLLSESSASDAHLSLNDAGLQCASWYLTPAESPAASTEKERLRVCYLASPSTGQYARVELMAGVEVAL